MRRKKKKHISTNVSKTSNLPIKTGFRPRFYPNDEPRFYLHHIEGGKFNADAAPLLYAGKISSWWQEDTAIQFLHVVADYVEQLHLNHSDMKETDYV